MSDPFLGEVKFAAFNFPPRGYALCNGQTLPVNQNQPLFSLLGTTYGGNGQTTFMLPNLQGKVPMHWVTGGAISGAAQIGYGQTGGEINHTLTNNEMVGHIHGMTASDQGVTQKAATGNFLASSSSGAYASAANTTMIGNEVSANNGGQPHNNMQPYQVLNAIIALQGIYPTRS